MRSATLFTNRLHSLDMPPVVRNTAGVKVAFSTFNTLSKYSSFFSFSFSSYTSWRVLVLFDKQLGCETLMSRKVLSNGVQTPLADMSSRTYVLYLNTKLFIFLTLVGMLAFVNCHADGKILSIDKVSKLSETIITWLLRIFYAVLFIREIILYVILYLTEKPHNVLMVKSHNSAGVHWWLDQIALNLGNTTFVQSQWTLSSRYQ